MDSTGSYEYSEVEREFIYNYIGDMQLYKKLLPLMNDKELNKQVGLSLKILEVFDVDKYEMIAMIEDLIIAAHNNAKSLLKIKTSEEISKATGGFNIPGFKWPL